MGYFYSYDNDGRGYRFFEIFENPVVDEVYHDEYGNVYLELDIGVGYLKNGDVEPLPMATLTNAGDPSNELTEFLWDARERGGGCDVVNTPSCNAVTQREDGTICATVTTGAFLFLEGGYVSGFDVELTNENDCGDNIVERFAAEGVDLIHLGYCDGFDQAVEALEDHLRMTLLLLRHSETEAPQ